MKILYPFSKIYQALSAVDRKLAKPRKFDKPVISVGNLTWGGTGKTPVVIEILKLLVKNNLKPAVLTRGYGRRNNVPLLLKNGAVGISPEDSGDEPLLIARSIPQAYVIVGADRFETARFFKDEIKPDVFILDDGFQHWKIKRDLDIVCINAANPFGNKMLIPAGILREKPEALKRADVLMLTNSDMASSREIKALKKRISKYSKVKPYLTYYGKLQYKTADLNKNFDSKILKRNKCAAISAIGFSKGFKKSLEKTGVRPEKFIILKDHHKYDGKTLERIFTKAGRNFYFVTTAKDAVKISSLLGGKIKKRVAVLTVEPQFKTGKGKWEKTILKAAKKH